MASNSLDFILNNNDLQIINGDFVIGINDEQHIADSINAFPGWWKENPADGVGIFQYKNSAGLQQEIARSIKINLQSDGYLVQNPEVTVDASGTLTIDPRAIRL